MPASSLETNPQRDIFSIARLNSEVRSTLEQSFPLLWVRGEISNLAKPRSGHLYFTLKDANAQVRCALFKQKRNRLRVEPQDGMEVLARARVTLYEPRGDFQLQIESLEAAGEGELQRQFEQLKQKLNSEGLFNAERKQELPIFPHKLGLLTSPNGAALHDILHVLARRFPALPVVLYPIPVQGAVADEIVKMLNIASQRNECDLLILARGGGSLEDLAVFNDETIARTIAACPIPIISAIGHEIDFTITDFVADRRAPTPSAAAELASPDQTELEKLLLEHKNRLNLAISRQIEQLNRRLEHIERHLRLLHPLNQLRRKMQQCDELELRLNRHWDKTAHKIERQLDSLQAKISQLDPTIRLLTQQNGLTQLRQRLDNHCKKRLQNQLNRLDHERTKLEALSPTAVLQRGYSITRDVKSGKILHDPKQIIPGQVVESLLEKGKITSRVEIDL